jgi:hypothetical protein
MTKGTLVRDETTSITASRADAVRLALLLTYITLGWRAMEGAASLLLGWASKSLLLEAFGIDSVIELLAQQCCFGDCESKRMGSRHPNISIKLSVAQRV